MIYLTVWIKEKQNNNLFLTVYFCFCQSCLGHYLPCSVYFLSFDNGALSNLTCWQSQKAERGKSLNSEDCSIHYYEMRCQKTAHSSGIHFFYSGGLG